MNRLHNMSADERRQMIAEAAYNRAEARGFTDGDPLADWLEAEREIDAGLEVSNVDQWLRELEERLAAAKVEFAAARKKVGRRAKAARADAKKDVDKLDDLLGKLEDRLDKLRQRGEKATQKARTQAEKTWDEISQLRQRLGSTPK